MNRKQRRSQASVAGAATKARMRRERDRLNGRPTNEAPSGLTAGAELVEMAPHGPMLGLVNAINPYLRYYRYGACTVIVSREFGRWHLSIAHPARYPTWEEISGAWYKAVPGASSLTGVLVLPPLEEYINVHNFCLHVWEKSGYIDSPCP